MSGEEEKETYISKYFVQSLKRPHKSSSSEGENSIVCEDSVFSTPLTNKPVEKKLKHQEENMDLHKTIEAINTKLDSLATKKDIESVRGEIRELTESFMKKIEELEGRMFELECRADKLEKDKQTISQKCEKLSNQVQTQNTQIQQQAKELNDAQQYTRRWNLRVYKIQETDNEECTKKVAKAITEKMGVKVSESDIEVAHRSGKKTGNKPRPILVRFLNRAKRDEIFLNKAKLKNKGVVVGEDLTPANYSILDQAFKHSATQSTWSNNGKLWAKLINGKKLQLTYGMNIDAVLRNEV